MEPIMYFLMLILYVLITLAFACVGKGRQIGYTKSFWLCFFVNPIIGMILILTLSPKKEKYITVDKLAEYINIKECRYLENKRKEVDKKELNN